MLGNYAWKDEYALGVESVDEQHKYLFKLVNSIYALDESETSKARIKQIIFELSNYVKTHFDDEERLMQAIGFPELEAHRLIHQKMITQLSHLLDPPLKLDAIKSKLRVMGKKVLIDHIMDEDMKITHFLKNKPEKKEKIFDLA
jgi:hemerythrin